MKVSAHQWGPFYPNQPNYYWATATLHIIVTTIIITRPKPASGRQGLAGSWGQDTDEVSTFLVFLTSHFAPAALSSDLIQPGIINDNINPPGIMKTRPGVIKRKITWNHEKLTCNYKNLPVTIKTNLEPRLALKTHMEPQKITWNLEKKNMKTHLEPWKTNLEPWETIKPTLKSKKPTWNLEKP